MGSVDMMLVTAPRAFLNGQLQTGSPLLTTGACLERRRASIADVLVCVCVCFQIAEPTPSPWLHANVDMGVSDGEYASWFAPAGEEPI